MEIKIKDKDNLIDATIEVVDGVMIVSPKEEKVDITKYKDGDVITCGHDRYQWTCILRGEIERICDNMFIADYCGINCDNTYYLKNNDSDSATWVRYATEEEKKLLFDKIEAEGYEWNPKEKKLVMKKWKPKRGEIFYHPFCDGTIFNPFKTDWVEETFYFGLFDKGWVFRTKEECEQFCKRLNQAIEEIKP
jgi:hypothetical protein